MMTILFLLLVGVHHCTALHCKCASGGWNREACHPHGPNRDNSPFVVHVYASIPRINFTTATPGHPSQTTIPSLVGRPRTHLVVALHDRKRAQQRDVSRDLPSERPDAPYCLGFAEQVPDIVAWRLSRPNLTKLTDRMTSTEAQRGKMAFPFGSQALALALLAKGNAEQRARQAESEALASVPGRA